MSYRYSLDEKNTKNDPHDVRSINQKILYKNPKSKDEYLITRNKINFGLHKELVKEEYFDEIKEAREEKQRIFEGKERIRIAKEKRLAKKAIKEKTKILPTAKEEKNTVTDESKQIIQKKESIADIKKLDKLSMIDRIVLNERNSIEEDLLKQKGKKELVEIIIEIENLRSTK